MKLLVFLLLLSFFSSLFSSEGDFLDSVYIVHGVGLTTCKEMNSYGNEKKFVFVFKVWLGGYFSAVNSLIVGEGIQFLKDDYEEAISGFIFECKNDSLSELTIGESVDVFWRKKFKDKILKIDQQ